VQEFPEKYPPLEPALQLVLWNSVYEKQMERKIVADRWSISKAQFQTPVPVAANILQELHDWYVRYDGSFICRSVHPGTN
jgi:hypothetical protein